MEDNTIQNNKQLSFFQFEHGYVYTSDLLRLPSKYWNCMIKSVSLKNSTNVLCIEFLDGTIYEIPETEYNFLNIKNDEYRIDKCNILRFKGNGYSCPSGYSIFGTYFDNYSKDVCILFFNSTNVKIRTFEKLTNATYMFDNELINQK